MGYEVTCTAQYNTKKSNFEIKFKGETFEIPFQRFTFYADTLKDVYESIDSSDFMMIKIEGNDTRN